MLKLTWPQVLAFWLQRHFLKERTARGNLPAVVSRICGRPYLRDVLPGSRGTLLKPGAYQGHLLFGPNSGQNVTFVNPCHWPGEFPELDTAVARLETLRRYLYACGPATPGDFGSWWGLHGPMQRNSFGPWATN